jgi:hypothetical protein
MVADGKDKGGENESKVKVVEDDVGDMDTREVEGRVFYRFREAAEGDVVVCLARCLEDRRRGRRGTYKRKPRNDKPTYLIPQLHMNKKLPGKRMAAPIQIITMKDRMESCEEIAVDPLSPLQDQLGDLIGRDYLQWPLPSGVVPQRNILIRRKCTR